MIWLLDTNILVYLENRKPGSDKIARGMSARSAACPVSRCKTG